MLTMAISTFQFSKEDTHAVYRSQSTAFYGGRVFISKAHNSDTVFGNDTL